MITASFLAFLEATNYQGQNANQAVETSGKPSLIICKYWYNGSDFLNVIFVMDLIFYLLAGRPDSSNSEWIKIEETIRVRGSRNPSSI